MSLKFRNKHQYTWGVKVKVKVISIIDLGALKERKTEICAWSEDSDAMCKVKLVGTCVKRREEMDGPGWMKWWIEVGSSW